MILNKFYQTMMMNRQRFDPKNKKHLEEYKYFVVQRKWRSSCPFWLEWPYLTVPDMVKDKLINNIIGNN